MKGALQINIIIIIRKYDENLQNVFKNGRYCNIISIIKGELIWNGKF